MAIDMAAARGRRASRWPSALGLDVHRASPGASTTSSTRTWRAPRACTSPSAARTRATTRCSCTGGAGPVHAYYVAQEARASRRLICPPRRRRRLGARPAGRAGARRPRGDGGHPARPRAASPTLEAAFARLEDEARAVMADTGLKLETRHRAAAGRRPLPRPGLRPGGRRCRAGPYDDSEAGRGACSAAAFEAAYREKFALTPPDVPVEFINIRVAVRAPVSGSDVRARRAGAAARARRRDQGHAAGLLPRARAASWRPRCTTAIACAVGDELARARGGGGGRLDAGDRPGRPPRSVAPRAATSSSSTAAERHERRELDAVTLEVLWTRIISVVDEAAKAIVRTSFSTLSNEANDFACVLTDARGYALAQNSGQHPVLHRHPARDRPPLPARDGRRAACARATCSSPTTRGWAPGT